MGFDVLLVGRVKQESLPLKNRAYHTKRLRLPVEKGAKFYAFYNCRLFFFLLFHKADILLANDLDTLLANFLTSRLKKTSLILDCHEYFRGVPELNDRPFPTKIWKKIEDWIFPKLQTVYAVNESIARLYSDEYNVPVGVIRNIPFRKDPGDKKRKSLIPVPEDASVILYQGSVNVDRGLEESISAMKYMKSKAVLVIIGNGDVFQDLREHAKKEGVTEKVIFTGEIPFQDLYEYTRLADIGISVEKDVSINYHFCLPNKLFDYIQARVPVLVSPLPEMQAIVEKYRIGELIESHDPPRLAEKFDRMLANKEKLETYRANLEKAAEELCWENEEVKLIRMLKPYA